MSSKTPQGTLFLAVTRQARIMHDASLMLGRGVLNESRTPKHGSESIHARAVLE